MTNAVLRTMLLLAIDVGVAAGQALSANGPVTVVSIGGVNPSDGDWFQRVGHIDIAWNGWICIADSGRREILCYSPDGELQASMGGEGDGPGELHSITAMTADSVVTAWDAVAGRATWYSMDGRVLGSEQARSEWYMPGATRRLRDGSSVTVNAARYAHGEYYDPYYRLVLSRLDSTLDTIARIRADGAFWYGAANGTPYSRTSTPFGSGGAWAFLGDSALVVADGYSGQLTWYATNESGLVVVHETRVPVDVRPVSDQDMAAVEQSLREELGDIVPREVVLRGPPSWSGVSDLVPNQAGDVIYIGSPADENHTDWRALHSDGSLDTIPLPPDFELKAVHHGVYYGVVRDELGVESVVGLRFEVGATKGVQPEVR